ncbi:hypothetical protein L561_1587 [Bordetella pertussis STO1-CHOC-0019]|nr:hypothetical protein L561_1587 [Bordetella pertussis STO1-CHOC-0019]
MAIDDQPAWPHRHPPDERFPSAVQFLKDAVAADPSAHRQPGRSASPSAASWPAPAVAQPGATSIRPPAICCTSTSRSWDVSSALATGARATDAIPVRVTGTYR